MEGRLLKTSISFWLLSDKSYFSFALSKLGSSLFSGASFLLGSLLWSTLPAVLPVLSVTRVDHQVFQRPEGPQAKWAFVGVGGIPSFAKCFACHQECKQGPFGPGDETVHVGMEALLEWGVGIGQFLGQLHVL